MQSHSSIAAIGAVPKETDESLAAATPLRRSVLDTVMSYAAIARPDHWFKNVFMLVGVLLAYFYHPELFQTGAIGSIIWAFVAVCLVASSNYVINEILDAPTDVSHPVKRLRPIPSGQVKLP